jgi:hypothetical protein
VAEVHLVQAQQEALLLALVAVMVEIVFGIQYALVVVALAGMLVTVVGAEPNMKTELVVLAVVAAVVNLAAAAAV